MGDIDKERKEAKEEVESLKRLDKKVLKEGGLIAQNDPDYFAIRLKVPVGRITPDQLRKVADVAEKEGRGYVHLSSRQGVEIPWIDKERMLDVVEDLKTAELYAGSCGPRVRNITGCPGSERCSFAQIETGELGKRISDKYVGQKAPHKFKISLSGCTNMCSDPVVNDFGIVGRTRPRLVPEKCTGCGLCVRVCRGKSITLEDNGIPEIDRDTCIDCGFCVLHCPSDAMEKEEHGYTIYIGGRMGRYPQLGKEIIRFASEEQLFDILEKTLQYFREFGREQERLSEVLERNGTEHFRDYVL
ncbi:MAG: 4Fe-4S binding protein [Candidatus Hydrothermarchaeales archaeon]